MGLFPGLFCPMMNSLDASFGGNTMKQIITALFPGSALAAAPASANVIKTRSAVFISKKGDGQEEKSTFRAVQHFCDNKPQCDFDVSNDWFQANDPDHQYVDLAQNQTK